MTKMRLASLVLVFGGVCCAVSVLAGEGEGHGKRERGKRAEHFKAADTDASGGLSLAEFKVMHEKRMAMMKEHLGDRYNEEWAAKMPSAEGIFAKIDADESGEITKEEMREAHKRRREHRGGVGPDGKRGPHKDKGSEATL